jgi:hypothetical protein
MEYCAKHQIDVIMVDPYGLSHEGSAEKDNGEAATAVKIWKAFAALLNPPAAIYLNHHFRKGSSEPGEVDAIRGPGALVNHARVAQTVTGMSEAEAASFGITPEDRRDYVRLDDGKVNMARKDAALWFKLVSVRLDNENARYPNGDHVATLEAVPGMKAQKLKITVHKAREILALIDRGLPDGRKYTDAEANAGDRWAGRVIIACCADATIKDARDLLKDWVRNAVLVPIADYCDPITRKQRRAVQSNPGKMPGPANGCATVE